MSALPPKLDTWRRELRDSSNPETAQQIIAEYFSFFGKEKVGEELWMLVTGTLTNDDMHQAATAKGRHDLIFFYEWTKMVMEAVYCLHAEKK
jgi:hypothetical protein